jgi:hypothetical protein
MKLIYFIYLFFTLDAVSEVFPREWKSFNDKRMTKELRRLVATVKSSEEASVQRLCVSCVCLRIMVGTAVIMRARRES